MTVAGNKLASMALQMHGKPRIAFRADSVAAVVILIMAFILIGHPQDVDAAIALQIGAIAQGVVYMVSTRDVGPMARQSIGGLRYVILVLLAPQICTLLVIARGGIQSPGLWLGSTAVVALLPWSGPESYRQFMARAVTSDSARWITQDSLTAIGRQVHTLWRDSHLKAL